MLNYGYSRMMILTTHRTPQSGILEVNQRILVQSELGLSSEYRLMGVVNHFVLERNHFVHFLYPSSKVVLILVHYRTAVRVAEGWQEFSDLDVNSMMESDAMATASRHSYVLFYERQ
jgi:ubiquitin C-terminal hydrolase